MPEPETGSSFEGYTIIIPVLNESGNAVPLAKELQSLYPGISIIFSDDGSTDGTRELVRGLEKSASGRISLLDRSGEKVKGNVASVVHAIEECKTARFIVMDGDFQHPPAKVGEIIREFDRSAADIVIASRASTKDWSAIRWLISAGANALGSISLAIRGKPWRYDIMSGFFGMKKTLFSKVDKSRINMRGYKLLFDVLKQLPAGTKISEIRYDFGLRKSGSSKISAFHVLSYCRSLLT